MRSDKRKLIFFVVQILVAMTLSLHFYLKVPKCQNSDSFNDIQSSQLTYTTNAHPHHFDSHEPSKDTEEYDDFFSFLFSFSSSYFLLFVCFLIRLLCCNWVFFHENGQRS